VSSLRPGRICRRRYAGTAGRRDRDHLAVVDLRSEDDLIEALEPALNLCRRSRPGLDAVVFRGESGRAHHHWWIESRWAVVARQHYPTRPGRQPETLRRRHGVKDLPSVAFGPRLRLGCPLVVGLTIIATSAQGWTTMSRVSTSSSWPSSSVTA
jgi:hypothetical protein